MLLNIRKNRERDSPSGARPSSIRGAIGVAISDICMCGYVKINGKDYEAFCRRVAIPKEAKVEVIEMSMNRLVVKQVA